MMIGGVSLFLETPKYTGPMDGIVLDFHQEFDFSHSKDSENRDTKMVATLKPHPLQMLQPVHK